MNWILILILWGPHGQTTTQVEFQTKFLCEKGGEEIVKVVNTTPADKIPLSGYWACEQIHKVDKLKPAKEQGDELDTSDNVDKQ